MFKYTRKKTSINGQMNKN